MTIRRVSLLYIRDGKLLTARTRGKDGWYLPGGKPEPGETELQALIREIREELDAGLLPSTVQPYGVYEGPAHDKPEGTLVRLICYTGELDREPKPSQEIEELRWMTWAEANEAPKTDKQIYDRLHSEGLLL